MEGRWLATYRDSLPARTVTHPSTNQARRRVTSLIETNALPLSHATNYGTATPPRNQIVWREARPPSNLYTGQLSTMCNMVWVAPQTHSGLNSMFSELAGRSIFQAALQRSSAEEDVSMDHIGRRYGKRGTGWLKMSW